MIIDCISDLHGHYPKLEGGDLLIVAGDLTGSDLPQQYVQFGLWLSEQKYERKILIGGNHDKMLQTTPMIFEGLPEFVFTYLCDSGTKFEGLKIWGSPWTKTFDGMNTHCKAFTVDSDEELAEKWALFPDDVDILVTHSPPYDILDGVQDYASGKILRAGSRNLLKRVCEIKPKLHIFGHIHEAYGQASFMNCRWVNASHVNREYDPVNKPIRIEL